ncbi:MAG: class I adenylate-forming enzyme family protein [Rhizobiaceae bacterium]
MNLSEFVLGEGLAFGSDRTAVIFEDRTLSYGQLADQVGRFSGLMRQIGARKGDRIVVLMGNCPEYYMAYLGAARAGVICATINIDYGLPEIAHMVRHADPVCVVADRAGAEKYHGAIRDAGLEAVRILRVDRVLPGEAGEELEPLLAAAIAADPVAVEDDDGVLLAFSSGSSGMPKPILTSHRGEIYAARSFRSVWRFNWSDRVLLSLALAWAYGIGTVSMPALSAGATVVLMPKFRPDTVSSAIERHRATVMVGVTTMFRMIADYAADQAEAPDLTSLRLAMTGGEKRNEPVFERFEALSGVPVHDIYAQSEIRPVFGYDPVAVRRPRPGAAGQLFPGVEARLVGDDGSPVAVGEPGELHARSPNTFLGYFRQPELTAAKRSEDGWVRTGDVFRVDEDGFWYLLGRKSADVINRGGVKISPNEIEEHLARHPRIRDVVVVPRVHDRYGEEIVACVVGAFEPDELLPQIRTHCEGVFADYKIPTAAVLVDELIYSANGKVDRKALTALVAKAA